MGKNSKIEWTDHTFNYIIGCTKISPGCKNCYAEEMMTRKPKWMNTWGEHGIREKTSREYWKKPLKWNTEAMNNGVQSLVFCGSLCDVGDQHESIEPLWRDQLFALVNMTPHLTWMFLTKRPVGFKLVLEEHAPKWLENGLPDNVWCGVSIENQATADSRIPELTTIPAKVHFISCEPLLEQVDLSKHLEYITARGIEAWCIVGGESGSKFRPFDENWARVIMFDCQIHGVPFFMKQLGGHPYKRHDMEDFPEDLQIREFPFGLGNERTNADDTEEFYHQENCRK